MKYYTIFVVMALFVIISVASVRADSIHLVNDTSEAITVEVYDNWEFFGHCYGTKVVPPHSSGDCNLTLFMGQQPPKYYLDGSFSLGGVRAECPGHGPGLTGKFYIDEEMGPNFYEFKCY